VSYNDALAAIVAKYPTFQVKPYTANWFFGWLWGLGWRMGATTLGKTVFMHPRYIGTPTGAEILRHERVHLDDQAAHPFWFFFSYLLLPPIGPGMRAFWEWRGYKEDLKESCERLRRVDPWVINHVANQFCGPNYLWMFPFRKTVEKWCVDFSEQYLKELK
jgi:hypothetical protein